jgi:hypothetical protein
MAVPNPDHAVLLYQALGSPIGIACAVDDFAAAAQALYQCRSALADSDLARLQFRRSPYNPEGEIWIVRGSAPAAGQEGQS